MNLHINKPSSTRFSIYYKVRGGRKWHRLNNYGDAVSFERTAADAARMLASSHTNWRHVRILMTADYYDPIVMLMLSKP